LLIACHILCDRWRDNGDCLMLLHASYNPYPTAQHPPPTKEATIRMSTLSIRTATTADWPAIWPIFRAVVAAGDTYTFDPAIDEAAARTVWFGPHAQVYVALDGERVVGTSFIRPNQPGLGAHVANAAFMVDPAARGQGVGRLLGEQALLEAARLGYTAMQFNAVVSTNTVAIRLWERLGFAVIGRVPGGFRHRALGEVDLLIMHRSL
jgi:GNAT superfamily N-acetyltransferase